MKIKGTFTDIEVKASIIDEATIAQLEAIANNKYYANTKIVVMPDTHAGKGCVVGFTMQYDPNNPIINPNIVGVDIGCGMLVVCCDTWGFSQYELEAIDEVIRRVSNEDGHCEFNKNFIANITNEKKSFDYYNNQIGTLGYGNHFVEIDVGEDGKTYFVIHTGSRHLGLQVCNYYMKKCVDGVLTGEDVNNYLHDMLLAQAYARYNRQTLLNKIFTNIKFKIAHGFDIKYAFETIHNYIDVKNGIIRKGAISAQKDELVLIPLNMKDGSIIGKGKGNADWNWSAPHGAGRVMSRTEAKQKVKLEDYANSMDGIYSSCINEKTIDESVFVYKPSSVILEDIKETIEVLEVIKPIYNFKNSK